MMNQTAKKIRSGWLGLAAALTTALLGGAGHAVETNSAVGGLSNAGGEERGTARVMGMDATYVGVADGADAIQWNPAGLGHLDAAEVGWHHLSGLSGAIGESIILGGPAGGMGGLALSAEMLDNGGFEGRDDFGAVSGRYDARTFGASLGWGFPLSDSLAIGATLRGSWQTLAGARYDSYAADAGVLWGMLPGLKAGVALANLGSSGTNNDLAMGIRAGASWMRPLGAGNHLLLAAATEIQPGGLNRINIGGEATVFTRLALRAGYRLNLSDQQLVGLSGLTLGAGVLFRQLALDYAFLPYGDLGNLHRVSLTFRRAESQSGQQAAQAGAPAPAPVAVVTGAAQAEPAASPLAAHVEDIRACGFECVMEKPDVLLITLVDDKTRFDFNEIVIKPEGRVGLGRLVDILNRFPDSTLRVDGYSDIRGSEGAKQRISDRRAIAVAKAMQDMGIAKSRFVAVEGQSDADPIVDSPSSAARRVNRRVEIRVYPGAK